MKFILFLLSLATGVFSGVEYKTIPGSSNTLSQQTQTGQNQKSAVESEKAAVKKVVEDYLAITDKKDYEAIKRAFHPSAKLMSVSNTGLKEMSQEEWWGRISRIPENFKRSSQISMIDVTGFAAVVRVDFDKSSDYISLLKINGEWKIVNKTLSAMLKS